MKFHITLYPIRELVILLWCIAAEVKANETDRVALLAIKSQIHDPLGVTSSWNSSVYLCDWKGVRCGKQHPRVIELDLTNQNVGGMLSPYVGNLSFLRSIFLEGNSFYGKIPQEVGRLFRLENLALSNNLFSGTIPINLSNCSNLVQFYAPNNHLVGEIPAEIGFLSKLQRLVIAQNYLKGQLPVAIGNLSALQVFAIYGNSLGGRIPDSLGQLRNLTFLNAGQNNFSGTVPPSIYNITSLEKFYLISNRFYGSLPLDIGFTLKNLQEIVFSQNNFTGSIPDSFSNASNLLDLDLSENYFSGEVSIDFSHLKNLSFLHLGINNLGTGSANDLDFLTSLTNCSTLDKLALYENNFGGVLPHSITNLSRTVTVIGLGGNRISGTIPPGISNLVNLNGLAIDFNELTGPIPHVIGELKNLQGLSFFSNNLEGEIPATLGNLTLLSRLLLGANNFHGNMPSSIGNCSNLIQLSVGLNKLTGTVPQQILGITTLSLSLDVADNLLSGSFPSEVGNLKNLIYLDISGNRFSGEIPLTLSGCTSLVYLRMQGNAFSGSIPPSLSSLKSIGFMDLSQNNLSGQIPRFLENLSFLQLLNLSYNHFEGEVLTKGVFSNATKVSVTGNEKLCGGSYELNLPSCHFKRSKKQASVLLKVLIPVTSSCLILLACFIIVLIRGGKFSHKSSSMLQKQFPTVSYVDLIKATNGFSSLSMIGKGSYGVVYKGNLGETGSLVAVKVFNLNQKGASKSFMAECEALRNVRHRNLMKIVTVCSSIDFQGNDFKALVYEYMQNGSLQDWLHQSNNQPDMRNLSLIQRLNIAIDVASAIEYLHHHCQPPIVHGDLKPSNVLLDHDLVAHVGDFGLAKFLIDRSTCTDLESQASSIGIRGTVGYVPPEYGMGSGVSIPGDVYSVGILLLEMFTGRRPTDNMFSDGLTLHEYVKKALPEKVIEIVDTSFLLEETTGNSNVASLGEGRIRIEECLVAVMGIGVLCSMESSVERMEMTDVVPKLCAARKNLLGNRV